MALERKRHMERSSDEERLLRRQLRLRRTDSLRLFVFLAPSRLHDQRRFTFGGWFSKLLEEQSLPNQPLHGRERYAAPAMGSNRYGHRPRCQRDPYSMGKSLCRGLCRAILGRRQQRDGLGHGPERDVEGFLIGRGAERQRWRCPSEALRCARHDALCPRVDVEILRNL